MKRVYFSTKKLIPTLDRLINQYGLKCLVEDWTGKTESYAKQRMAGGMLWETGNHPIEQDTSTLAYKFAILMPDDVAARLPKVDNPNFSTQYEGETDPETGELLPHPTFITERPEYDIEGNPTGQMIQYQQDVGGIQ